MTELPATPNIDFLTVILTQDFTVQDFFDYAREIQLDEDGVELGPRIPVHLFEVNYRNNLVYVEFRKGSEKHGVHLANKYNLRVSRIDLCLDLPDKAPATTVKQWFDSASQWKADGEASGKTMPTINWYDSTAIRRNGAKGFRVGAASSENQLRVYDKANYDGSARGVRFEYQLRGEKAEAAFGVIRLDPTNATLAREVIDGCFNRYHSGMFDFPTDSRAILALPERSETKGDTRAWILGTVFMSLLRWFDSTGEDLAIVLEEQLQQALIDREARNAARLAEKDTYNQRLAHIERKISGEKIPAKRGSKRVNR